MSFDELWGQVRGESTERVLKGSAGTSPPGHPAPGPAAPDGAGGDAPVPAASPDPAAPDGAGGEVPLDAAAAAAAREAVLERLAHFRSSAVLVPMDTAGGLWTADFGGIAWICAFSDEAALARFAQARGEEAGEWTYRRVLGSRLLDDVVPTVASPCGVALDAGSPGGSVFPPVQGIVPDGAAVDVDGQGGRRS
ncbi:hypothetical protein ACFVZW_01890 [Streptomyces sp. NPDC059567]|uniref:hypothetical protein n=1 Tax=Streptomyces sp. NPDC059567 TaxID=3346867 RepID=UPI00367A4CB8